MVLGDRAAPLATLARRIAEARKALTLRPAVHVVEDFAALLGGRGRGDRAYDVARGADIGEARPEERGVGYEGVCTGRSRWQPYHLKKKTITEVLAELDRNKR